MSKPNSVIIDGVTYVPVSEVNVDAKKLLVALAATWWGWDSTDEINDTKNYDYLRVVVSDSFEDYDGVSLTEFVAELMKHFSEKHS